MPDPPEPTTVLGLPAWGFAFPGPLRDRLTALVRRDLRDPTFALTDSTPVVCQWFRLVERLAVPA